MKRLQIICILMLTTFLAFCINPQDALWRAVDRGNIEQVNKLLSKGAEITSYTSNNAVHLGNVEIVKILLDYEPPSAYSYYLRAAVEYDNIEIAKLVFDKGAKIVDSHDLLFKTVKNNNTMLVRLLIEKGAKAGNVDLHYYKENTDIVKMLVDIGVKYEMYDVREPINNNNLEILKILINKFPEFSNFGLEYAVDENKEDAIKTIILEGNIKYTDSKMDIDSIYIVFPNATKIFPIKLKSNIKGEVETSYYNFKDSLAIKALFAEKQEFIYKYKVIPFTFGSSVMKYAIDKKNISLVKLLIDKGYNTNLNIVIIPSPFVKSYTWQAMNYSLTMNGRKIRYTMGDYFYNVEVVTPSLLMTSLDYAKHIGDLETIKIISK